MAPLFRRWFGGVRDTDAQAVHAVREWAQAQGHRFATIKDGEGFVVEGALWRAQDDDIGALGLRPLGRPFHRQLAKMTVHVH